MMLPVPSHGRSYKIVINVMPLEFPNNINKWESVSAMLLGMLRRLNINHLIMFNRHCTVVAYFYVMFLCSF